MSNVLPEVMGNHPINEAARCTAERLCAKYRIRPLGSTHGEVSIDDIARIIQDGMMPQTRVMLAGMMAQGLLANQYNYEASPEHIAKCAIEDADALIAELANPTEGKRVMLSDKRIDELRKLTSQRPAGDPKLDAALAALDECLEDILAYKAQTKAMRELVASAKRELGLEP